MAEPHHIGTKADGKHAEPLDKQQNSNMLKQKRQNLPIRAQIPSPKKRNLQVSQKADAKMTETPHTGANPESEQAEPLGKRQKSKKLIQKWQNLPIRAQIRSPNKQNL